MPEMPELNEHQWQYFRELYEQHVEQKQGAAADGEMNEGSLYLEHNEQLMRCDQLPELRSLRGVNPALAECLLKAIASLVKARGIEDDDREEDGARHSVGTLFDLRAEDIPEGFQHAFPEYWKEGEKGVPKDFPKAIPPQAVYWCDLVNSGSWDRQTGGAPKEGDDASVGSRAGQLVLKVIGIVRKDSVASKDRALSFALYCLEWIVRTKPVPRDEGEDDDCCERLVDKFRAFLDSQRQSESKRT